MGLFQSLCDSSLFVNSFCCNNSESMRNVEIILYSNKSQKAFLKLLAIDIFRALFTIFLFVTI